MNFLMRPNQEVRGMFAKEFEIMDDPYTLKIGIQVRCSLVGRSIDCMLI